MASGQRHATERRRLLDRKAGVVEPVTEFRSVPRLRMRDADHHVGTPGQADRNVAGDRGAAEVAPVDRQSIGGEGEQIAPGAGVIEAGAEGDGAGRLLEEKAVAAALGVDGSGEEQRRGDCRTRTGRRGSGPPQRVCAWSSLPPDAGARTDRTGVRVEPGVVARLSVKYLGRAPAAGGESDRDGSTAAGWFQ